MLLYLDNEPAMLRHTAREFVAEPTPVRRLRPSKVSFYDGGYVRLP